MTASLSDKQRFMLSVEKTPTCWIWKGNFFNNGYGCFYLEGRTRGAHVAAFMLFKGEAIQGLDVEHKCNVRACVRPAHLRLMTRSGNLKRIADKHCRKGHKRTKKNTYVRPNGKRECLDCKAGTWAAWTKNRKKVA